MNQSTFFKRSSLALAVALLSPQLYAAGFYLNEYSTSGLGRAFSGEGAFADDATVGSRNPAAMMMFDSPAMSAGAIFIDPDVNLKGTSPLGNSLTADNIAPTAWIPNLHFIYPVNEQWALGASATTMYGLSTDFAKNYPAGPLAGKTDLKTSNLNLSAAYRFNEHFSFGLGFDAVYGKAKISRHAGDALPRLIPSLNSSSTISYLDGDGWGYGWNAGLLYEVDKDSRFALTYRSKVDIKFKGDYRSDLPQLPNNASLSPSLPVGTSSNNISGKLTLNLPEIWEFSAYQKVDPKWAIHYGVAYTTWHRFKELRATKGSTTLFQKHEGFRDAYRVALGTTYYHDDNWTFRTGIAFDDSPVPAKNRSISIPDQDRFWISAGTTYAFDKNMSVDLGISYMKGKSVNISEKISDSLPAYEFNAKGTAWLYGVNFNYKF